MRFYIPPNMDKDFMDAVNSELGTSFTINFDSNNTVRAIVPELDYRAKQEGFRGVKPFHAEPNKLKVGDYIQDGTSIFMVAYLKDMKYPKCAEVQVQVCNAKITVLHFNEEVIDSDGNLITPAEDIEVVKDIYAVAIMGGYQFQTSTGSVGIVPSDQIAVQIQYNVSTMSIQISDTFNYFNSKYRVENITYTQVNIDKSDGMIIIFAKKIP